jgi:hypothetical protein
VAADRDPARTALRACVDGTCCSGEQHVCLVRFRWWVVWSGRSLTSPERPTGARSLTLLLRAPMATAGVHQDSGSFFFFF